MTNVVTTMMMVNEKERARERKVYGDRRKEEDQQRTEAEEQREAQRKLDDEKRAVKQRDDIKRLEKLEERRQSDQQKHELLIVELMQNLYRGTSAQTQPQPSTAYVTVPLPYPPPQPTLDALQTTTDDIIASLNETKLNDDITAITKKFKQHHPMDFEKYHPKLTTPPQAVNMKENTLQYSPPGSQQ